MDVDSWDLPELAEMVQEFVQYKKALTRAFIRIGQADEDSHRKQEQRASSRQTNRQRRLSGNAKPISSLAIQIDQHIQASICEFEANERGREGQPDLPAKGQEEQLRFQRPAAQQRDRSIAQRHLQSPRKFGSGVSVLLRELIRSLRSKERTISPPS